MVQAVTGHVEDSICYDETKNCVSVLALLSVYHLLKAIQLDGTARPSMLSDLIERNTDKDGRIDSEEDIAASVAVAYAGMSSHVMYSPSATQVTLSLSRRFRYRRS